VKEYGDKQIEKCVLRVCTSRDVESGSPWFQRRTHPNASKWRDLIAMGRFALIVAASPAPGGNFFASATLQSGL
jgi:hypothetical protein